MSLVFDASVAVASSFPEERTQPVRDVLVRVEVEGAWVPSLWRLEVGNILGLAVRRGRHSPEACATKLSILARLPIELDPRTDANAWSATFGLASTHRLTLYDAAYLELAVRRSLPLATLDRDLRAAAEAEGVPLLGL